MNFLPESNGLMLLSCICLDLVLLDNLCDCRRSKGYGGCLDPESIEYQDNGSIDYSRLVENCDICRTPSSMLFLFCFCFPI